MPSPFSPPSCICILLLIHSFLLLSLRGHVPTHFRQPCLFFHISPDCLRRSHASDLLAQWKCSFSWTRSLTAVKLSSLHPPLHLHTRHSCLFVFHSLTSYSQPNSPCGSVPRGEEQTPIITQVSVKWITGWLIELLDGKHPSWVVRLCAQAFPSSLCRCLWLARGHRKGGCGPVCAVADAMWQSYALVDNTSAEMCFGTGKLDDATFPDEMQPEAVLFHTIINHSRKNYKLRMRRHSFTNYLSRSWKQILNTKSINFPWMSPDDTCMCWWWCDL